MNRSDKKKDMEILKALLIPQKSLYGLEKNLKETLESSNYATVYRHINRMKAEGLLKTVRTSRRNGKQDKRETQKPELTVKGFATVLIDGDFEKEELQSLVRKVLQIDFRGLSPAFLTQVKIDDVIAKMLLRLRPRVNLKYFDEEYFVDALVDSFKSVLEEAVQDVDESTRDKRDRAKLEIQVTKALDDLKEMSKKEGFSQDFEDILNRSATTEDRLKKRLLLKTDKQGA